MFDKLKKLLEGGIAQANIFDGGKTFQSVVNNRTPQQQNAVQQQARTFRPSQPSVAPQQTFTNKLRDILDANTEADKFRRAQVNKPVMYKDQQAQARQQASVGSKIVRPEVQTTGLDNVNKFSSSFNERYIGGIGRGLVRAGEWLTPGDQTASADRLVNTFFPEAGSNAAQNGLARLADKNSAGGKLGTFGKGVFDTVTIAVPSTSVSKAAQGTQLISNLSKGGNVAKVAAKVLPELAASPIGSLGYSLQERGRGNKPDIAKEVGIGAGLDLATPLALEGLSRVAKPVIGAASDALGRIKPRSVAEIADEVNIARTAPQTRIAYDVNQPRVASGAPEGGRFTPRPASEIAAELQASKARAIDPNVAARRASLAPTEQVAQIKRVNMHPDDQRILADFNDIANGVYTPDARLQRQIELDATRIAEKHNIPLKNTTQEQADVFDNVLQRGVTKPEFAPKPPRAINQNAPKPSKQDPLEALKAEARKYKSADEFVKAQGGSLYSGSKAKYDKFDFNKADSGGLYGNSAYMTPDAKRAASYGSNVTEYVVPKNAKLLKEVDFEKRVNQILPSTPYRDITVARKQAVEQLIKEGYDGVKTKDTTAIFNPDALRSKQQLTNLYNQANKTPRRIASDVGEDILPRAKKAPEMPADIKRISDRVDSGEMVDRGSYRKLTQWEENTRKGLPATQPSTAKSTALEQGAVAPTKRTKGTINTERLNLTDTQKADLKARQNPIVETMSHKEIEDIARGVGIDTRSHTIEQTKEIIAKQLNTRGEMVALERKAIKLAKEGGDPLEIGRLYTRLDELGRASTEQGTDIARQLSARRILADESKTPMQRVFGLLHKAGVNPEVYTKKAVGVDFDNPNDVIRYYRELVPPTKGEWLDVVRYNSMLSSPLTQIVNISSTSGNIAIAPIERTVASGLDFIHSLVTGKPRKFAGGEGVAYAKGMVQSIPDAVRAFRDSLKGIDENMNLDVSMQGGHIPVAAQGQNKLVDILQFPTKLLGAFDNYHRVIVAGGSDAALSKRMQAGINVRNKEVESAAEGAYRTFNQEIGEKSQGGLLGGIDEVTAAVNRLRSSKYAVVRLPAKFTLPFVRIGANLMKQGIEYSPAGIATIPGANDKTTQLAKALMGTAVFGTAAGLLGQDRLTWAEPINPDQKAAFRQAGKQPYSMKIGDKWIGFSKLPPIISFNMAMVAALDDVQKNAKIDDNGVDNIITAIAKYTPEAASKYGKFLADQSYVKSVGDLLAAVQGDPEKVTSLVSNYPQQMIPMRAFSGWIAKMGDDVQRKVNTDAGFAARQVESLMQQIPGLRQQTTARVNEYGEPIAAQHPVLNAFSPVPVTTENADGVLAYDTMVDRLKTKRDDKALLAKQKEDYKSGNASGLTDKQKAAVDRSIKEDEVVKGLTPVQRELYKYSKDDLESLLDGPNAKNAKVALDAKNSISSSKEAKTNKEKYEAAQEEFDNPDNGYSRVEKVKKREELKRLAVQKDYDEDTTMLHGMSKEDVYGFLSTYEDGKAMADKLLALDDALTAAGVQSKNKFRDKYGNVTIQPKAKGGSKGRKGSTVVKGQAGADASAKKLRALLASTNNKTTYRSPGIKPGKASLKKFAVKSAGLTSRKQA